MTKGVLNGKVALVTGAGSPIGTGSAMANALVHAGARVVLFDIREDWLSQSLDQVRETGGRDCAIAINADVSNPEAAEEAVARTIAELGRLDVLVNNAGTTPRAGGFTTRSCNVWEIPVAAWDRVIAVNFSGAFYMMRAALTPMLAQGSGRIIGVTTSLSTMYRKRATPYGPSKAGHEALVAALARELEGTGVTANILVPGGRTDTNFFKDMDTDRTNFISPGVMAAPAVWLASDDSQAFNGRRIIACHWDERMPLEARFEQASTPAAWQELGDVVSDPVEATQESPGWTGNSSLG